MYQTPAADGSTPHNGNADFYRQSQYVTHQSPSILSSGGGSRPKPRMNTSSSPNSSPSKMAAFLQSQHEEMEAKIERDRMIYSGNKDVEARVRRELEESKVSVTICIYISLTQHR